MLHLNHLAKQLVAYGFTSFTIASTNHDYCTTLLVKEWKEMTFINGKQLNVLSYQTYTVLPYPTYMY